MERYGFVLLSFGAAVLFGLFLLLRTRPMSLSERLRMGAEEDAVIRTSPNTIDFARFRTKLRTQVIPPTVVFDASFLLDSPVLMPNLFGLIGETEGAEGIVPNDVLLHLADLAKKGEWKTQAAFLLEILQPAFHTSYISPYSKEVYPETEKVRPESVSDKALLCAYEIKLSRPGARVFFATTDGVAKLKAASLGIETL